LRRASIAAAVMAFVVALFWVMGDALEGLNVPRAPLEPTFEESAATTPPPIVDPPPGLDARRSFWLLMLTTGDEHDVEWSKVQIRRDGKPARALVLGAGMRSIRSNLAFVQQALDILLESPAEDCYPFARDVLESRDPHAVNRAVLLLAELGALAEPLAPRLATLAVEREYPIPQYAMTALARIGTPAARDAAMDAVSRMDAAQRGFGYVALAEIGGDEVIEFMRAAFEVESEPLTKLAAAEGLVRAGDETPLPWLRAELARTVRGTHQYSGSLRVLARAQDDEALQLFVAIATDTHESDKNRANAIETIAHYPLSKLYEPLGRVVADRLSIDARVAALDVLIRKDAPGRLDDVRALLFAPGRAGADDRRVGALVLGRLRRPDTARALIDALSRLAPNENEDRALYLRALALTGADEAAELIARAIASDTSGFGVGGLAFDVLTVLGSVTPEFRKTLGPELLRALDGAFGSPSGSGLQSLILATPVCCGEEAAAFIEPFVEHRDRPIREASISALAFCGRQDSLLVLRRAWRRKQDELLRATLADTIEKLQFRAE